MIFGMRTFPYLPMLYYCCQNVLFNSKSHPGFLLYQATLNDCICFLDPTHQPSQFLRLECCNNGLSRPEARFSWEWSYQQQATKRRLRPSLWSSSQDSDTAALQFLCQTEASSQVGCKASCRCLAKGCHRSSPQSWRMLLSDWTPATLFLINEGQGRTSLHPAQPPLAHSPWCSHIICLKHIFYVNVFDILFRRTKQPGLRSGNRDNTLILPQLLRQTGKSVARNKGI